MPLNVRRIEVADDGRWQKETLDLEVVMSSPFFLMGLARAEAEKLEQSGNGPSIEKRAALIAQLVEFLKSEVVKAAQAIEELTRKGDLAEEELREGRIDANSATTVLKELERALELFKNTPSIEASFTNEMAHLGASIGSLRAEINNKKSAAKA